MFALELFSHKFVKKFMIDTNFSIKSIFGCFRSFFKVVGCGEFLEGHIDFDGFDSGKICCSGATECTEDKIVGREATVAGDDVCLVWCVWLCLDVYSKVHCVQGYVTEGEWEFKEVVRGLVFYL